MKILILLLACLGGVVWAADSNSSEEIFPVLTAGTNVYRNARITKTTATEAFIKFEGGLTRAKLSSLPPEIQLKYPPSATPDPPAAGRPRRPQVAPRVSVDVALRNLEAQIIILERAKERLLNASSETEVSGSSTSTNRPNRIPEIDRNLGRLRADLAKYKAIQEQAEARGARLNSATNTLAAAESAPQTNNIVQRRLPPFGANRPAYRNGPTYPPRRRQ